MAAILVLKVTLVFCFGPKELLLLDSELDQAEQKQILVSRFRKSSFTLLLNYFFLYISNHKEWKGIPNWSPTFHSISHFNPDWINEDIGISFIWISPPIIFWTIYTSCKWSMNPFPKAYFKWTSECLSPIIIILFI